MHQIQQKLLSLAQSTNLAQLTLRGMAAQIGMAGESPQKIKHHLGQLERRGFLRLNKATGTMSLVAWGRARGIPKDQPAIFNIPVIGSANCGPARLFAEENIRGYLRVSSRLVGRSKPKGLFAIVAEGNSMNRAELGGRRIEHRDFLIVEKSDAKPRNGEIVVSVIDGMANVKRFVEDPANEQIVLLSESSADYPPIFIHAEDDFRISGRVICVIKRPQPKDRT